MDATQNYGAAFYSCAIGMGLSAVFLGLVKPAKKGLFCRRRSLKNSEDECERTADCREQSGGQKPDKRTNITNNCSESHGKLDVDQAGATEDVEEGTP